MSNKQLPAIGSMTFEDLKQANEHGAEYWSARDLQPMLGYSQWRRFEDAVKRDDFLRNIRQQPSASFCRRWQNGGTWLLKPAAA